MPIMMGTLRGKRWVAGVANHSCWIGTYERDTQKRLRRLLAPGNTFYDVGGNAGFFTLFGAHCVGPAGRVVAFEPNRANVAALRRHVALNGLDNVEIIEAAVSDSDGTAEFVMEESLEQGHLTSLGHPADLGAGKQAVRIPTVSLDSLVASGRVRPPDVMKIDVEGAEFLVLQGARETLQKYRPSLVIEFHNPDMDRRCPEFLLGLGYEVTPNDTWPGTTIARGGVVAVSRVQPNRASSE